MCDKEKKLKLAIIGCGAISANAHIPNAQISSFDVVYLVDKNLELANSQASYFDIPNSVDDLQEIIGKVDATIRRPSPINCIIT